LFFTNQEYIISPSGNAYMTIKSKDAVKLITIRGTNFEAAQTGSNTATIEKAPEGDYKSALTEFVFAELTKSDRPSLTAASEIISGGRGLKSGDNFKLLYDLADQMGAAAGASRAAVDAGYVPNKRVKKKIMSQNIRKATKKTKV
jgi:electron transfer flavoprotein alpha subunit